MQRKRLEYIDATKALAIFMIMYGHITTLSNPVDTWMSSCKVSVFYVISGFLIIYSDALHKRTPWEFVKNLTAAIAWPYLTFSIIATLVKTAYIFSRHAEPERIAKVFFDNLYSSIFLNGINSMWFLPTIFFGQLIILALYKIPRIFSVLYAVAGLLGFRLALGIMAKVSAAGLSEDTTTHIGYLVKMCGKSIVAAWFLGFGCCLFLLLQRTDWLEGHYRAKLAIGAVLTISNIWLSLHNRGANFNGLNMGTRPLLFIYGGTLGSIGLILLLDVASRYMPMGWLSYWGRNSLIIMCTHTALGFKRIAYNGWKNTAFIPDEPGLEYVIECFFVLLVLTLLMYGVIEGINGHLKFLTRWPGRKKA